MLQVLVHLGKRCGVMVSVWGRSLADAELELFDRPESSLLVGLGGGLSAVGGSLGGRFGWKR